MAVRTASPREPPAPARRPDAGAREEEVGQGADAREEEDEEDPREGRGDPEVPRHRVDERHDVEREGDECEDLDEAHAAASPVILGRRRGTGGAR